MTESATRKPRKQELSLPGSPVPQAVGFTRDAAAAIVRRLHQAGHDAFWVGGCVRDLLRGVAPEDYDIVTSARPDEVQALFSRTVTVGARFGVVLVIEEGRQYEVATFRTETGYDDGRHPA
ncbi:MAG: hypothetical protein KJ663_08160, partial [Proteobacteria bacterium]|nr:hypothetical protein [Pseudomonadota bacterium]